MLAKLNERLLGISTPHHPRSREPIAATQTPHQRTSGNSALDKCLSLYRSANPDIRSRAAGALIARPDVPLTILLDILDNLSHYGLGASTERALLKRQDPELLNAMIARLESPDGFIREVACNFLGRSNSSAATPHLLRMIDDPHMMVRRAAGLALSRLKDSSAIPELKRQFAARRNDDTSVVWALRRALETLGVSTDDAK
jgi:HEAT repeat protein